MTGPFTDDPIVPGVTPVKAVHFTELRTRIDVLRREAGLASFPWTDPALRAGVTPVRVAHLLELREALAPTYAAAGRAAPRWTDATPVSGATPIRAVHLTELRVAVTRFAVTRFAVTPSDDFSGQVLIPTVIDRWLDQSRPVAGVSVTIVTGERAGESVDTKHDGRYTFPEFDGDEIHIRLEKDGYEPKEAIVHRSRPTTLTDRVQLGYDGPQDTPGTVLISMEWPDYIRPAMQRMQIPPDLILIVSERGMYGGGVIEMPDPEHRDGMTHEICHAQQQAVVGVQGASDRNGGWTPRWDVSPVGLAYQEATEADIEEVGRDEFWVPEDYPNRLVEAGG